MSEVEKAQPAAVTLDRNICVAACSSVRKIEWIDWCRVIVAASR